MLKEETRLCRASRVLKIRIFSCAVERGTFSVEV